MDTDANNYLTDILSTYHLSGVDLVPIVTSTDGSCLPDAISRGLVGLEVYYDCMRENLHSELKDHEEWYRNHLPIAKLLDNDEWRKHWDDIILAAAPTRGSCVSIDKFLESVHILGMANVLQRPILLVNARVEGSAGGRGLYLPLRHTRAQIIATHSRCLGPLAIAWQNKAYQHYVCLCRRSSSISTIALTLCDQTNPKYQAWQCLIHELQCLPEHIYTAFLGVLLNNHAGRRDRACNTMAKLLSNILLYLDQPVAHADKVWVKLSNDTIRYHILSAHGAIDFLLACGFVNRVNDEHIPCIHFPAPATAFDRTCCGQVIQQVCNALNHFALQVELKGVSLPGSCELSTGQDALLFGALPFYSGSSSSPDESHDSHMLLWAQAKQEYGDGSKKEGDRWCIADGDCTGNTVAIEMMKKAQQSFDALSKGSFGSWTNVEQQLYTDSKLRCPICLKFSTISSTQLDMVMKTNSCFMCLHCPRILGVQTPISIKETVAIRLLRLIERAFSAAHAAWRCEACDVANTHDNNKCHNCHTTSTSATDATSSSPAAVSDQAAAASPVQQPDWPCSHCTFLNPASSGTCEQCTARRGSEPWHARLSRSNLSDYNDHNDYNNGDGDDADDDFGDSSSSSAACSSSTLAGAYMGSTDDLMNRVQSLLSPKRPRLYGVVLEMLLALGENMNEQSEMDTDVAERNVDYDYDYAMGAADASASSHCASAEDNVDDQGHDACAAVPEAHSTSSLPPPPPPRMRRHVSYNEVCASSSSSLSGADYLLDPPVGTLMRHLSEPVTSTEMLSARDHITADTKHLERVWRQSVDAMNSSVLLGPRLEFSVDDLFSSHNC